MMSIYYFVINNNYMMLIKLNVCIIIVKNVGEIHKLIIFMNINRFICAA